MESLNRVFKVKEILLLGNGQHGIFDLYKSHANILANKGKKKKGLPIHYVESKVIDFGDCTFEYKSN